MGEGGINMTADQRHDKRRERKSKPENACTRKQEGQAYPGAPFFSSLTMRHWEGADGSDGAPLLVYKRARRTMPHIGGTSTVLARCDGIRRSHGGRGRAEGKRVYKERVNGASDIFRIVMFFFFWCD